jgi:hypothetical protein|eukprot:COSAG06_NODE_2127_length_7536_cov_10.835821_2_plen_117_part_00
MAQKDHRFYSPDEIITDIPTEKTTNNFLVQLSAAVVQSLSWQFLASGTLRTIRIVHRFRRREAFVFHSPIAAIFCRFPSTVSESLGLTPIWDRLPYQSAPRLLLQFKIAMVLSLSW